MSDDAPSPRPLGPEIDTTVPHSARIWNYWLGGKDNYPVDRAAGDQYRAQAPGVVDMARASRIFLSRAVRHLAGKEGVRQFLDIGTGLPTMDNTHEVAQRAALRQAQEDYDDTGAVPYVLRTPAELALLYEGLELLEPGQVSCLRWRPEADLFGEPEDVDVYGAAARKP